MQQTVGAVFVAALVVLAGCSGVFGGDGEPTETLTPAAVPTDEPTPTPVPQFVPGVTGQGIEDVDVLIAAHTSFLQNRSLTQKSNSTELAPNGSIIGRETSTLRAGPSDEGVYFISESNGSYESPNVESYPVRTEGWENRGRLLLKRTFANGTTTYDRFEQQFGNSGAGLRYLLEPFGTANTSVEKLGRNGTTLYLVQGNTESERLGNVSMRLLIDDRGFIHSYRTVRKESSGENITGFISETRYTEVGETEAPERPSWVDEAMNRTSPTPDSRTETSQ